jgi:hypothetical protein
MQVLQSLYSAPLHVPKLSMPSLPLAGMYSVDCTERAGCGQLEGPPQEGLDNHAAAMATMLTAQVLCKPRNRCNSRNILSSKTTLFYARTKHTTRFINFSFCSLQRSMVRPSSSAPFHHCIGAEIATRNP